MCNFLKTQHKKKLRCTKRQIAKGSKIASTHTGTNLNYLRGITSRSRHLWAEVASRQGFIEVFRCLVIITV